MENFVFRILEYFMLALVRT